MDNNIIKNICNRVSETLPGAKTTKTPYSFIVEIPKLNIKVHIESPTYKNFYKFSIIIDDPISKTFKVLKENSLIPEYYEDKGFYISSYLQYVIFDIYYDNCESYDTEKAWLEILNDNDALSRLL